MAIHRDVRNASENRSTRNHCFGILCTDGLGAGRPIPGRTAWSRDPLQAHNARSSGFLAAKTPKHERAVGCVKRTSRNRGALHAPYGNSRAKSAAFRGENGVRKWCEEPHKSRTKGDAALFVSSMGGMGVMGVMVAAGVSGSPSHPLFRPSVTSRDATLSLDRRSIAFGCPRPRGYHRWL
jgi:hypothetical protein